MNERILATTVYPTIKKNGKMEQKVASMSKIELTEKINNSKFDYFDIISKKIINKKKLPDNSPLLHNYLLLHNKQKQNYLRHKLINLNTKRHMALITEPNSDKKYYSYKKIPNNNLTFYDSNNDLNCYNKNKLIITKKYNRPLKLNKILNFEEEKKNNKKVTLSKKRKPIEFSSDYKDYIGKKCLNNFFKYSNMNTDYAHNIRASFYEYKVNESLKKEQKSNDKYLLREKEKMEDEKELRDKVLYPSLDIQKISDQIKLILRNEYKFGHIENKEPFFDKYVNRINFLFDNFKPPSIKNNLTKIRFEDLFSKTKNVSLVNRIGDSAINYVSNEKVKIQREKDEKIKFLLEKNKIKKKYGYYKKLSSSHIYNSKEEIEKIIYKNYYLKSEDDFNTKKETISLDELFEIKNYFENKYEKYEKISIVDSKLRKYVFNNLNEKFSSKKNNSKIIKFLLI